MTDNINTIKAELAEGKKLIPINSRVPVIVKTIYGHSGVLFGVQYWSEEMVNNGCATNTDGSISHFMEMI
jgi:hypothetical protein